MSFDPNRVKNPNRGIAQYLYDMSAFRKKDHCYPNQKTMVEDLGRFYGIHLSIRTLQRHLNALVADMFVRRIRRHKRGRFGMQFHSTTYVVLPRWFGQTRRTITNALKRANLPAGSIDLFHLPKTTEYRRFSVHLLLGGSG